MTDAQAITPAQATLAPGWYIQHGKTEREWWSGTEWRAAPPKANWYQSPTHPGFYERWNGTEWTGEIIPTEKFAKRNQTNHTLHLILSICTLGLWIPVWIVVGIVNTIAAKADERSYR
jgi:hypothetical protein